MSPSNLPCVTSAMRAWISASLLLVLVLTQMPVARAQTAAIVPPSQNNRWMAEMAAAYPRYGELRLSQAIFPGSHDAGAYDLDHGFSPDIPALANLQFVLPIGVLIPSIQGWSETQNTNFTGQLQSGVRYFDLRLCAPIFQGDPVRFCHGLYGTTLEDGLNQFAAFAGQPAHSKEIIIVHVAATHAFSEDLKTSTKQLIKDKLGSRMLPKQFFGAATKLQDVWASGKSVIVLFNSNEDGFWGGGWLKSPWPGELNLQGHDLTWWRNTVVANLACRCDSAATNPQAAPSHILFGLQIQATTDVLAQIGNPVYMQTYPFGDLEGATATTNPLIMPAVLDMAHHNLNVVITDFASDHGFVEAIKNLTVAKLDLLEGKVPHRAYLSRTESPRDGPAVITTSFNGTHYGYSRSIANGAEFILPGYPSLAHFGSTLFAGDLKVTSIPDDFLKIDRLWTDGAGGFALDLNDPGLPDGVSLPASYAEAYGRFYVASITTSLQLYVRSSPDGRTFPVADRHALPVSSTSFPVLATRRGVLYIAWMGSGRSLQYGRINRDGTFVHLGTIADNLLVRPAMTGFGDHLVFAWTDHGDRKLRVAHVDAAGIRSGVITLADTTDAPPSLAVFKGSVILAYTGQNRLRFTLVSPDGLSFPGGDRASQGPAMLSSLTPPTLHAWGDRAIVTVHSMANMDGSVYTAGTWTRQDVTVSLSCEAPVAGVHGFLLDDGLADPEFFAGDSVLLVISGSGLQTPQVSCVDLAGHATPIPVEVKIDRTPPTVTYLGSVPSLPPSGWLTGGIVATFACADANSGVVNERVETILSTEGKSQWASGTCVDAAGNSATSDSNVIFNIDNTPPAIFVRDRMPAPNGQGWNNSPVNVSYHITDPLSGVSGPAIGGVTFSTDGVDHHRVVTVTDVAGNSADVDVRDPHATINVDRTAPNLAVPDSFSVKKGGQAPFVVEYSGVQGSDVLSGLASAASCDHPSGSSFNAGVTTVGCTVSDKAGNTTTKSFAVTVLVNSAPEIASINGATVSEGGSATISVAASDPDGDAPLTYEFDCQGDGTFELASQTGNTASCVYDDDGAYAVTVRVADTDSATATSSAVVTVNNVAPSATITHSGPVDEGGTFTIALIGATDPASADRSAGFEYAFNCGGGYGSFSLSNSVTCPAGGSGIVGVRGKVRDKDGGESEHSAAVTINGVPPAIAVPAAVTASASGPEGAVVTFDVSAIDALDGSVAVNCSPASSSIFRLGTTQVSCSAADHRGNTAAPVTFDVTVTDDAAPDLALPASFTREAEGPAGLTLAFAASATDNVDGSVAVTCAPASPATFGIDATTPRTTTVECSATDHSNNTSRGSFTVTVVDTAAPILSVPSALTVAASGVETTVSFAASANDVVDGPGVPVVCSPASGSPFPLGATPVTCSSTDAHGNARSANFVVTLNDVSAPALTLPANIVADATGIGGAVVTFNATAIDAVDGLVAAVCAPASESRFPVGTTPVSCSAVDRAGNQTSGAFMVTVLDVATPGMMRGDAFIREGDTKYAFDFIVRESASGSENGSFQLRVSSPGKRSRSNQVPERSDWFVASGIAAAFFSDDPTIRPGRARQPQTDSVTFAGAGWWHGAAGYRYEVFAQDAGEPGRHRESVRIVISDPSGRVVASLEGEIDGGNVQSARIHR